MNMLETIRRFLPAGHLLSGDLSWDSSPPVRSESFVRIAPRACCSVDVRAGGCIECLDGCVTVWIDDETWDVTLSAGELWTLDRTGQLTFYAGEGALVRVAA